MSEIAKTINKILYSHKLSEGMVFSMGATCQCGYWTGDERPGITRPAGVRDALDWHRAELIAELSASAIRAHVEKLAGLIEVRLEQLRKAQDERDALNRNTVIQDCKIDALETTLASFKDTPIGDGER